MSLEASVESGYPADRLPPGGGFPAEIAAPGGLRTFARWCRESIFDPVMSVLFPPRCVGCGDFESHLCARCEASLLAIGPDCCPRCGEPGPRPLVGQRCSHCMGLDVAYAGARSAFVHAGVAKRMVVEFKSGGQPVLAPLMARLAGPAFADLVAQADAPNGEGRDRGEDRGPGDGYGRGGDHAEEAFGAGRVLVTWVPTHAVAQRERGYNQAELLARALAAGHGPMLPAAGLARKPVRTRHQKALDRAGRQANLRGAFALEEKAEQALEALPFRPAALVLVDDVYTTGATTQEVAQTLAAGMGTSVYVFTFSRAVSGRGEGHD
jgi:predicted amidophosphoribosyltransferase